MQIIYIDKEHLIFLLHGGQLHNLLQLTHHCANQLIFFMFLLKSDHHCGSLFFCKFGVIIQNRE
jgi:hypothetical protein